MSKSAGVVPPALTGRPALGGPAAAAAAQLRSPFPFPHRDALLCPAPAPLRPPNGTETERNETTDGSGRARREPRSDRCAACRQNEELASGGGGGGTSACFATRAWRARGRGGRRRWWGKGIDLFRLALPPLRRAAAAARLSATRRSEQTTLSFKDTCLRPPARPPRQTVAARPWSPAGRPPALLVNGIPANEDILKSRVSCRGRDEGCSQTSASKKPRVWCRARKYNAPPF